MPYSAMRFYGQLKNLDHNAKKQLKEFLSDLEPSEDKDEIEFFYEGSYIDYDWYIDGLKKIINKDVRGQIDVIDFEEWRMIRYVIKDGKIAGKKIHLNEALEKYNIE